MAKSTQSIKTTSPHAKTNSSPVKQTKMQSRGLTAEKEFKEAAAEKKLELDPAMQMAIAHYTEQARRAFEQRERNWEYFDGNTYYNDYILNRQAANSYLRPKLNDDEVRVNTGTTEKKIEVVYNSILSLNLEPDIRAFDKNDNLIVGLGDQFTNIVKRTNEIEQDEDMMRDAILELLTQRALFMKEIWEDVIVSDVRLKKLGIRRMQRAKKVLVSGLKVYLGDITLPWYKFDQQPYIVEYDRVHWRTAAARFKWSKTEVDDKGDPKENPMWRHVSAGSGNNTSIFGLRYGVLQDNEVEILTIKSFPDDEIQHLVNMVPMDPLNTELPWEYEGYNLKMFGLKTMSRDFAYCKPLTASAKTLQGLNNETIRLLIRKWRQALEPPLGVKAGKVFSKDIFSPAATTQGVGKDDFSKLIDHDGVTSSEFAMFQLIEKKTEEFIGAGSLQQGLKEGGKVTATEIREQQKQFVIQLGLAVLGTMAIVQKMTFLRLYNLMENATKAIGKTIDPLTDDVVDAFRQYTKEDVDLGKGKRGTSKTLFINRDLENSEKERLFEKEKEMSKAGREVRFNTINIPKLLEIPINWFVSVSQSFKDSDALDQIMFRDALAQGADVSKVSGRPLSGDAVIQDFERTWKKKDWFQTDVPALPPGTGTPGAPSSPAEDLQPAREQKASLNTVIQPA